MLQLVGQDDRSNPEEEWEKRRYAFKHYRHYLRSKPSLCYLSITDLVYVRNFKEGNSGFGWMASEELQKECDKLSARLNEMGVRDRQTLQGLEKDDYRRLRNLAESFVGYKGISGFNVDRLGALLHCLFPSVFPVFDKYVALSLFHDGETSDRYGDLMDKARKALQDGDFQDLTKFDKDDWGNGKEEDGKDVPKKQLSELMAAGWTTKRLAKHFRVSIETMRTHKRKASKNK